MTISNEVKNVINEFVETQFIDERTGRLINKKINYLLNNYEYSINEDNKKEHKKLTNKFNQLTIENNKLKVENKNLRKEMVLLQNQIKIFEHQDNELLNEINNMKNMNNMNNINNNTDLFRMIVTIIYQIILGIVYSYIILFILYNINEFCIAIDFKSFDELKHDMNIYLNSSKYYVKEYNNKYIDIMNHTFTDIMNKLNV